MKKLFLITAIAANTLFISCSAKVSTPVGGAGVKVGSTQQAHPSTANNSVRL
jgi:hypothetical protein